MFVPIVRSSPLIVKSPAIVAFAPLNVRAVVVPDLITKLPDEFSSEPKVVEASCRETIPSSVFSIMSPATSNVKSPEDKSNSVPFSVKLSTTREPPVIAPVVVIVEEPVSIVPKPEVMLPAFNAPTVVTFYNVSSADSK